MYLKHLQSLDVQGVAAHSVFVQAILKKICSVPSVKLPTRRGSRKIRRDSQVKRVLSDEEWNEFGHLCLPFTTRQILRLSTTKIRAWCLRIHHPNEFYCRFSSERSLEVSVHWNPEMILAYFQHLREQGVPDRYARGDKVRWGILARDFYYTRKGRRRKANKDGTQLRKFFIFYLRDCVGGLCSWRRFRRYLPQFNTMVGVGYRDTLHRALPQRLGKRRRVEHRVQPQSPVIKKLKLDPVPDEYCDLPEPTLDDLDVLLYNVDSPDVM